MVFLLDMILNLAVLFLFLKLKMRLHILEIFIYWLTASYFFQNYSALCVMNLKTLLIPDQLSLAYTHF